MAACRDDVWRSAEPGALRGPGAGGELLLIFDAKYFLGSFHAIVM